MCLDAAVYAQSQNVTLWSEKNKLSQQKPSRSTCGQQARFPPLHPSVQQFPLHGFSISAGPILQVNGVSTMSHVRRQRQLEWDCGDSRAANAATNIAPVYTCTCRYPSFPGCTRLKLITSAKVAGKTRTSQVTDMTEGSSCKPTTSTPTGATHGHMQPAKAPNRL